MTFKCLKALHNILKIQKSELHRGIPCTAGSQDQLKQRQAEMMAKGLPKQKPIDGVGQILLVASGKGGVGKSTTAVNLAVGLKSLYPNKEVGLLDADVFGPCVPIMMNLSQQPFIDKGNKMIPLTNYGVKCMSMGFLYDKHSPAIWRGLMVMSAIDRLIRQVTWAPLDWLIVDTPPGTGDTHLSLVQTLPIAGVILVTTPQIAALSVARRGGEMFRKLGVPLVGLVSNMAKVQCLHCGEDLPVFGFSHGPQSLAKDLDMELLAEIPISPDVAEDTGKPVVLAKPDSPQAMGYINLAQKVATFLDSQLKTA